MDRLSASRVQRVTDVALLMLFIVALILPSLDMLFHVGSTRTLAENRRREEPPGLPNDWASLQAFPRAFDAYWNDSFGFRSTLIRLHTRSKLLLGASSLNSVVVGQEPWLFYSAAQSMEIYAGKLPMSADELVTWQRELEARTDWMASRGGYYLLVVAPNKESIYGEHLPSASSAGQTRLDQLVAHLRTHSTVRILDLRDCLRREKATRNVYFYTDTHWNDFGAYAAYSELFTRLTEAYPSMRPRSRDTFQLGTPVLWYGDLAQMLGMNELLEETRIELIPDTPYGAVQVETDQSKPAGRYRATMRGSPAGPRAVVFHDSFFLPPEERGDPARAATAAKLRAQSAFRFVPLLAENFSHSEFTWSGFDPDLVTREGASLVIQEVVERALRVEPEGRAPRVDLNH